ncbi:MAG: translocation/assembly module TamB domain-containing protein [Prosthecobacter sp.]|uniref:translocation/assembly module TamB domain-containing protein n=1 Tax=Prosthecobacter sp. TaxID=1965333 RepID=UPI0019DA1024|nr:translocation/assembly module TamB domain-containing protein [Prosthecobacter sp.]MBE2283700.1 translocation/assembly module TamB domain-containing protein [Prosthecobacter sp.]
MSVFRNDPTRPRRWLTWLKRLLLAGFALLLLAVVFHAPLLRWVIGYGGIKGAELAGITLKWRVDGSVLGDLKLSGIDASGSLLEKASIGEIGAEYDAWTLARTGDIDIVKRITLKNVDAVVDLRKLPPATTPAPEPPKKSSNAPPPLVWPKVIDIENVNAVITLAHGGRIIVRGLTLRVGEGMPGVFELAEFKMEPGDVRVADVKAQVQWGERTLTIAGLDLPYGTRLKALAVDLTKFPEDAVKLGVELALGKASVRVDADASGLFAPPLKAKADVKLEKLSSADLAAFKLPADVSFDDANIELHAEGLDHLTVTGDVKASNVRAAGAVLDSVHLPLRVENGRAQIDALKIVRGTNTVQVTAEATLPQDLAQWQKIAWKTHADVAVRDVTQLLTKPPPAKGAVLVSLDAQGLGGTPTQVKGHVGGEKLVFEAYKLPKVDVDFALDGKEATVRLPALALGDGNTITLDASMKMEDAMPVKAAWKVQIDDPVRLMQTVGLPPLDQPVTAKIATTGKTAFLANDVMNLDAEVDLNVTDGKWGDAALPAVAVKATVAKGEAHLNPCRIVVDDRNRIEITAEAKLAAPWSFVANGDIALPQLTSLNALLAALKAPSIESGSVAMKLDVKGDASPWRGEGRVELKANEVKTASMPEAADVDLKTTFDGTTAQIETLRAVLGPWKLITAGKVTDKDAQLTELSLWQKDRQLMTGHAHAPFDLMQTDVPDGSQLDVVLSAKDLPVHEIAAAAGVTDVPPGILNAEVKIGGRLDSADLWVKLGVSELKAPGVPASFKPAAVDVSTALKANRLTFDAKLVQEPLQPLTLTAELPVKLPDLMKNPDLAMNLPVKATLDLPESDLGFVREFAPDVVKSLPAKLRLHATVGGTVKEPLIDSSLDLNAPEVGLMSADMPSVRDVRVKVRTHDRKATIEDISAVLAGGKVRLAGVIDAASPQDPKFDLKVEAREALVMRNPTSSVRANADITCAGTQKAARVSGTVEAVRGRIFQEVNLLPNVTGMIQQGEKLPPPPPSTSKVDQKLALPPMLKDWSFDLKVKTRDPVVIAGNLVNGAVSADIALGGTGAAPRLTGFANVDRMVLKLPFSLLKITKGVVTMNPDNPFTPKLDVRGESRVGSNDITLYVYGDASNPKTRFTSTPPLSEADIVTLLGTGMTLGGDNAQMASEAMTRAAFLVISETYRKIFNKKKTVSDEPPKLHTTFNPSGSDRANDSMQAMYEITPKVRFIGRFTQTGRMKALLGYVLRFGQAARAMDDDANDE